MIKVGIIGCGKIAQVRHIPEYLSNPNARLAGYYDFNAERAAELASRYGGKTYSSAEELLEDPQIDAVSICVANQDHARMAIAALEKGKHVLCEKPMAMTPEDCERMVLAAQASGKTLMIDQNQRLTKAHQKAKEILERGDIGRVLTFRSVFGHGGPETWSVDPGKGTWFFDRKRAVMGAMADLGVHKTDLIQYLLGARITEVSAVLETLDKKGPDRQPIAVDDNAICIYKMDNGAIGTMEASWTHYGEEDNSTVLYGTKGILKIYGNPDYALEVTDRQGFKTYYALEKIQTNDEQTSSGVIDAFVDGLEQGLPAKIDGKSVLSAMRAVFAAVESARTGRTVRVAQGEKE